MTRTKTGALPGRVPSAATGDDSDDGGRQSDMQPGGYAVEESDGASPHESERETDSGGEGSCTHTVDSRIGRAATDNLGRDNLFEGGVQASATAAAGVSDATTSAALESSTECLARQQPPALLPGGPKPRLNPTKPNASSTRRRTHRCHAESSSTRRRTGGEQTQQTCTLSQSWQQTKALSASKRHPKALNASKRSSLYSLQVRERPSMLWHPLASCTIHLNKAHKNNSPSTRSIRLS
jgi:hypothetical protein